MRRKGMKGGMSHEQIDLNNQSQADAMYEMEMNPSGDAVVANLYGLLGFLENESKEAGSNREKSITRTKIEEAIMWRKMDISNIYGTSFDD